MTDEDFLQRAAPLEGAAGCERKTLPCPTCRGIGAGWNNSAAIPCKDCGGTGSVCPLLDRQKET